MADKHLDDVRSVASTRQFGVLMLMCFRLSRRAPSLINTVTALAVAATIGIGVAHAEAPARMADVDELSHRLMVAAGIDRTASDIGLQTSAAVMAGFNQAMAGFTLDETTVDKVREAASMSFAPLSMTWIVERHLRESLNDEEIHRLLRHYESPLGRQLLAASTARSATADPDAFARFVGSFGREEGDAERYRLLQHLVIDTALHEQVAALMNDLEIVTVHGAFAMAVGSDVDARDAAIASVKASRAPTEATLLESLPIMLAYTYDGFDTAEHRELVAHSLTGPSMRADEAVVSGLREAFAIGIVDFQRRVRPVVELATAPADI